MSSIFSEQLPFSPSKLNEAKKLIQKAENILIISHRGPDGDTVGANLALKHAFKQWGKTVTSACIDPPPEYGLILPGCYEYVNDFELSDFSLVIAVDCGAHYMMKFHETKPELLSGKTPLLNIDHHASNDQFGTHNIVDPNAAAAVFTVYHLIKYFDLSLTRDIANCLMMGLYFDTGSFMHSNTSPSVLAMAADLLNHGADFKKIVKQMFHTTNVEQLKLWGRVMRRARINQKNAVVSAVTNEDYADCGTDPSKLTGVIDLLNSVPEADFTLLVSEDQKGNVKGSMRTQHDHVNVAKMASKFGGGGHKKAAGFTIKGKLQPEITWKVVS